MVVDNNLLTSFENLFISTEYLIPADICTGDNKHGAVFVLIRLDDRLKKEIQNVVSELITGRETDFNVLLKKFDKLLMNKTLKEKMGLISEFITHVFLISHGYKQNFLFSNLEEKSAKKGFDGLYTYEEDIWLVECKSGGNNKNHKSKIREAFNDLNSKIFENNKNNPWENAYYHAMVAKSSKDLLSKLSALDDQFEKGSSFEKNQFCILPVATIFSSPQIIVDEKILRETMIDSDYSKSIFLSISQGEVDETVMYIREALLDEIDIEKNV